MSTLRAKVAAMREAIRSMRPSSTSGVRHVPFVNGVPDPAAVEALGQGTFIVMPEAVDAATWEEQCQRQQQELQRRAAAYLANGFEAFITPEH
jgi:hypothetical protein